LQVRTHHHHCCRACQCKGLPVHAPCQTDRQGAHHAHTCQQQRSCTSVSPRGCNSKPRSDSIEKLYSAIPSAIPLQYNPRPITLLQISTYYPTLTPRAAASPSKGNSPSPCSSTALVDRGLGVVVGGVGLGVVVRGAVGLGVVVGVVLGRVGLGRGVVVLGVLGGVVLRSSSSQEHAAGERSME